eukprot:14901041-Heterocapsa_arctica.AAC.1
MSSSPMQVMTCAVSRGYGRPRDNGSARRKYQWPRTGRVNHYNCRSPRRPPSATLPSLPHGCGCC